MRSLLALSFLASATASTDATLESRQTAPICGVAGVKVKVPYSVSIVPANTTPLGCLNLCKKNTACKSYGVGPGQCWLFKSSVSANFLQSAKSPYSFFDMTCNFATPIMTFPTKPVATPFTPDPAKSPAPQTPDPIPQNSPNLVIPSDWVPPPDPAQFVESYTYSQGPLPTPIAMGTPPNDKGVSHPTAGLPDLPPCNIDPNDASKSWFLAGSNYNPVLASGTTALVPMTAPTSEAHARSMGWPGDIIKPAFQFKQVSGAPTGIYDLVMVGTPPRYVAKYNNGVVLTDSSTGTAGATRSGKKLYTSIFQVSCIGRVTAMQGTTRYTLDTTGGPLTFTASSSNKSMIVSPNRPASSSKLIRRGQPLPSNTSMVGIPLYQHDLLRRSPWNSGSAPRCPKLPERLISNNKWDAPLFTGISSAVGCLILDGIAEEIFGDYFPPPDNMDDCCMDQGACFANCNGGVFEDCNSKVDTCMSDSCQIFKEHWWLYLFYGYCELSAILYSEMVKTLYGRLAWWISDAIYCTCQCPVRQGLCDNDTTCKTLWADDKGNCGACGRTCPDNSRCVGGTCTCLHDKCGDTCLSLLDNPDNCGACGNVCDSGYCWQGKCYDPPPCNFHGIENHNFADSSQWVLSGDVTDPANHAYMDGGNLWLKYPENQGDYYNEWETETEICPDKKYAIRWSNYRDAGSDPCQFEMWVGTKRVATQTLGAWDDSRNGPLQNSNIPQYEAPQPVSRFSFDDAKVPGSKVRRNGLSLYAKVRGRMTCNGQCPSCSDAFDKYGIVRFGDVQLYECEAACAGTTAGVTQDVQNQLCYACNMIA